MQINLPDYTVLTVNLLLDLLYEGKTDRCGDIDHKKGQLSIRLLYIDLGFDPECGGLPDIAELDTVEIDRTTEVVEIGKTREVVVVQQIVVKEEIKEVPSNEVATSGIVDLEVGVNDNEDEVKVIVNTSSNARVNEVPVNRPTEKVEEIVELELKENENFDENSELLGVDVNDLLSEDEVRLDFDYETYEGGEGLGLMDTSASPVVEDSECLKEFSKIELKRKYQDEEENTPQKWNCIDEEPPRKRSCIDEEQKQLPDQIETEVSVCKYVNCTVPSLLIFCAKHLGKFE